MEWVSPGTLCANENEEDPKKRVYFRQVGWYGQTGAFYGMTDDVKKTEPGGFSPIYIQLGD